MQSAISSEYAPLLIIIAGAVFVHVCYQLSVSVLTRLSSHTIGAGKSQQRLLGLSFCYILGVALATTAVTLGIAAKLAWLSTFDKEWPNWIVIGLLPVIGLVTILFYYRRDRGTKLWLPRPFTSYLMDRAKKTRSGLEASMLGAATVLGELPFIIAPIGIVALWIYVLVPADAWLIVSTAYAAIVSLPLVFVALYISSGHKISSVQHWRERNKTFLQWTSGLALILLDAYLMSYMLKGVQ